uniref:Uncharacterized protein n=1 Tax=Terrapene triunguis TaxID=2587831 RepID=A0A674K7Z7_9SAUR
MTPNSSQGWGEIWVIYFVNKTNPQGEKCVCISYSVFTLFRAAFKCYLLPHRKYWCHGRSRSSCDVLGDTENFVKSEYKGRLLLLDNKRGDFLVTMHQANKSTQVLRAEVLTPAKENCTYRLQLTGNVFISVLASWTD